ncbi:hypothetical protein HQ590_09495 [bacterium]|nr:hypothetical protein [bacterium]
MFEPKIRVPAALYEKLEKVSRQQGYSSVEEMILHLLENVARCADEGLSEEEVRKRLQGLGYLG